MRNNCIFKSCGLFTVILLTMLLFSCDNRTPTKSDSSSTSSVNFNLEITAQPYATDGGGNAVDIACSTSKHRYELVQVAQKFFNRIGISGGVYGGFVHLDVDREKVQEVMWLY